MTRLHLEDHWVTPHLPGYSVVEGAHWGVARVLRCGLAANSQFVILVLKQFYHDNVEYYEVQIVCMYFYSRSALHCTLNKEITCIFGSLKKFKFKFFYSKEVIRGLSLLFLVLKVLRTDFWEKTSWQRLKENWFCRYRQHEQSRPTNKFNLKWFLI